MRHLMSPLDFSVEELDKLLDLAQDIEAHPAKYAHACAGKKLATLFYEPSTRTRLSHEAAMLNLGGSIMGFSSADSSSAAKGESVSDTIRHDFLLCRHLCYETPEGRRSYGRLSALFNSCYQRRRRRASASDTDADRPAHDPQRKRTS